MLEKQLKQLTEQRNKEGIQSPLFIYSIPSFPMGKLGAARAASKSHKRIRFYLNFLLISTKLKNFLKTP
jgi:hypothetical protein